MSVLINASTSTGLVQSADTSGEIELQSNGTTALKVNTNEGIQILNCLGVGNATPSTSGAGITFPATQSASSDANTLDDYEEGTWTPGVVNVTFVADGAQSGRYIKIGRVVTIFWDLIGNWSSSNGSNARISGLPFVPDTDISKGGYSTAQFRDSSALPSGTLVGWFDAGASNIYIESNQRGAAAAWQNGTALRTTGMAVYLATS